MACTHPSCAVEPWPLLSRVWNTESWGCAWEPLKHTLSRTKEHSLSLKQGKIFPHKAIAGQYSRPRDHSHMTKWGKTVHMRLPFPTRWHPYIDYTRSVLEIGGQNFLNFHNIFFLNFPCISSKPIQIDLSKKRNILARINEKSGFYVGWMQILQHRNLFSVSFHHSDQFPPIL